MSMVNENHKIRQVILQILYSKAMKDRTIDYQQLCNELIDRGYDNNSINFHLRYLNKKEYLKMAKIISHYSNISIDIKGIEHIEASRDFCMTQPLDNKTKVQAQNSAITQIHIDKNYGNVNAVTGQGNIIKYSQISNIFNEAREVLVKKDIDLSEKVQIGLLLNELEAEVCKGEKANKGRLEEGLKWLKQHILDIAALVEPLILKVLDS